MNRVLTVGIGLTAVSLAGYGIGIAHPYPGRAFAVTGVMVGVALLAVGGARVRE